MALLAVSLLYERFSPSDATQKIIAWLFLRVSEYLDKWIGSARGDRSPMACSQLVFRCFQEAPSPCHLEIRRPETGAESCLIDRLANRPVPAKGSLSRVNLDPQARALSDEVLVGMLLESLQSDAKGAAVVPDGAVRDDLASAVHVLGGFMHLAALGTKASKLGTQFLVERKPFYVTPFDLLRHCPILEDGGEQAGYRDNKSMSIPVP
jgi:hypothetical protein